MDFPCPLLQPTVLTTPYQTLGWGCSLGRITKLPTELSLEHKLRLSKNKNKKVSGSTWWDLSKLPSPTRLAPALTTSLCSRRETGRQGWERGSKQAVEHQEETVC
jgi:hypothetical protein